MNYLIKVRASPEHAWVDVMDTVKGSVVIEFEAVDPKLKLDAIDLKALQQMIADSINDHFDQGIAYQRDQLETEGKETIEAILKKHKIDELLSDLSSSIEEQ